MAYAVREPSKIALAPHAEQILSAPCHKRVRCVHLGSLSQGSERWQRDLTLLIASASDVWIIDQCWAVCTLAASESSLTWFAERAAGVLGQRAGRDHLSRVAGTATAVRFAADTGCATRTELRATSPATSSHQLE
jgi:hypothetical protein